jgi:hypothetical protein
VNSSAEPRTGINVSRRWWVSTASVVGVGLLLIASIVTFESRSGSSPTTTIANHGYSYSVGSPILALKLTHLEMLTSRIGVGVAPIVTYSGALVRAYLVRTNDAGETWTVTGDFPRGFYPWTTAFTTPRGGYVISSGGALFTKDAGRTWSKVVTSYSPLSISINGQVVWIPVENYCPKVAMNDPCGTFLDSFRIGSLVTTSVSSVPNDQPLLSQVAQTKGYAIGSGTSLGRCISPRTPVRRGVPSPLPASTIKSPGVQSFRHPNSSPTANLGLPMTRGPQFSTRQPTAETPGIRRLACRGWV